MQKCSELNKNQLKCFIQAEIFCDVWIDLYFQANSKGLQKENL